jgi:uncharacterized integral membrane protein
MRWLRRVLVVVVFVGLFAAVWRFVGGNDEPVAIDLLFGERSVPLWSALLGAFVLGALVAGLSLTWELAKKSVVARRYRKRMAGLESEIHQLRNLPLAAPEAHEAPAAARAAAADDAMRS